MSIETPIAAGGWLLIAQVSTNDLVDIINNSIITLAVVLPAVAIVVVALGYVALFWSINPWWRASVIAAVSAGVCAGLVAVGGQVLRALGITAVLDTVHTPLLTTVTTFPFVTTLLAGGTVLGVLAVAFALAAVATAIR
jgi:hypothetical protein